MINCSTSLSWCIPWHSSLITLHRLPVTDLLQPAQLLFQQPRPITHQTFNQPSCCSNSHAQSPTRPSTSPAAVPTATPSHPPDLQPAKPLFQQPHPVTHHTVNTVLSVIGTGPWHNAWRAICKTEMTVSTGHKLHRTLQINMKLTSTCTEEHWMISLSDCSQEEHWDVAVQHPDKHEYANVKYTRNIVGKCTDWVNSNNVALSDINQHTMTYTVTDTIWLTVTDTDWHRVTDTDWHCVTLWLTPSDWQYTTDSDWHWLTLCNTDWHRVTDTNDAATDTVTDTKRLTLSETVTLRDLMVTFNDWPDAFCPARTLSWTAH